MLQSIDFMEFYITLEIKHQAIIGVKSSIRMSKDGISAMIQQLLHKINPRKVNLDLPTFWPITEEIPE